MRTAKGSCFCGSVQFEFELPSKFVVNCHCSECRRAHGAAFVTWVGTWEEKLSILQGAEHLATYAYNEPHTATRQFCKTCGSPLFFRGVRWPGEVHVSRACITGNVDKNIQADVFYSDRAHWCQADSGVSKLGGASGTEPLTDI